LKSSTPKRSEAEIRAAQEAKNHQDFIYQTNQTLQNLSEKLINLSLLHEKKIAEYSSMHKKLEIAFENLQAAVAGQTNQAIKVALESSVYVTNASNTLQKHDEDIKKAQKAIVDLSSSVVDLKQDHTSLENTSVLKNCHVHASIEQLRGQINAQIGSVRQELQPAPLDLRAIEKTIEEKLMPYQIDFAGLFKEINFLKKSTGYADKKIENLYTLIDRMRKP
jgi:hypothetical protein